MTLRRGLLTGTKYIQDPNGRVWAPTTQGFYREMRDRRNLDRVPCLTHGIMETNVLTWGRPVVVNGMERCRSKVIACEQCGLRVMKVLRKEGTEYYVGVA